MKRLVSLSVLVGLAAVMVGCGSDSAPQPTEEQLHKMLDKPPTIPGGGAATPDPNVPPPGMKPAIKPGAGKPMGGN